MASKPELLYNSSPMREIKQDHLGTLTTSIFYGSDNLMRLLIMLRELPENVKFKVVAAKPEVTMFQLLDKIAYYLYSG